MLSQATGNDMIPASYELIYKVPFKTMYMDRGLLTVISVWNAQSEFLTDADYKKDIEDSMYLMKENNIHGMISDNRCNKFNISEDLQKWQADLVSYVLGNSSFEKCAVIVSADLNLLSALEEIKTQVENAGNPHDIFYRFFNQFREAHQWLISKNGH